MNVIELIERMSARLDQAGVSFGHGTANAFDEAAWLVLWRLKLPLDALDAVADRALGADEERAVAALIEQRIASRMPAAYLTHEAWLQGVPFYVDARTIVPRSLIAEVLDQSLIEPWLAQEPRRVLDLATGNGSLAVLAARAWADAHIDAADISRPALEVARINVERHGLTHRITLVESDLFDALPRRYDVILCNPPYVNSAAMAALPPEFRAEPALALSGGRDGMDFVRRLLAQAPAHLKEGGCLVLEIGHERAHFEAAFGRLQIVWLPTSAGDDGVLLVTRDGLETGAAPT